MTVDALTLLSSLTKAGSGSNRALPQVVPDSASMDRAELARLESKIAHLRIAADRALERTRRS